MARLAYALLFTLMAAPGWAQDGLRSASLPERTPTAPIPPAREDLFQAKPDAYRLHRSGLRVRRYVPILVWSDANDWHSTPEQPPAPVPEPSPARPALIPPPA